MTKTSKAILILDGHPAASSLSSTLSSAYAEAAKSEGHSVTLMHLHDMEFDPDFGVAHYYEAKTLEHDLEVFLEAFENSDHFVLVSPLWWGGLPAKLKGLFDRALLPGRSFDPRHVRLGFPKPLLSGRTGRVILTSDTVDWYFRLIYRRPVWAQLKHQILGFIGIKPVKLTHFATANTASPERIGRWTKRIENFGRDAR